MTLDSLAIGCVVMLPILGLCVLTGVGALRRGASPSVTVISAALFPLTWVLWYVKDNLLDTYRKEM